jgi:polysaccharide biosynthesis transport protein
MEFKDYFRPLFRWWWVLIVASIVAGTSTFLYTRQQPPVYQSRTTLVIGSSVYQPNPSNADLYLSQSLARFYADLARRKPTQEAVMDALGLTWLPSYVVQPLPQSQLLEVRVNDTNPLRAQAVANELVNQLIILSPVGPEEQDQQSFLNEQIFILEESIRETREEISKKQAELNEMVSARQISEAENDIRALQGKMTTLQTNYANLMSNSQRGASNRLTVIEPANLPTTPIGSNHFTMVLLSAAIGFSLAAGAAYLLEYIDDTVKSSQEVSKSLKQPVIGYIGKVEKEKNNKTKGAYITHYPRSVIAEGFRHIRANLETAEEGDKPAKIILVTSPGMGDGKSFTSTNLATVMAQGGKKVVLIDTDLRKPSLHTYLELDNSQGLSDLFMGKLDLQQVIQSWREEKVFVITTGDLPHDPAEQLSSKKMEKILAGLSQIADIIILDGPPMVVVDATILAKKADGVLVVARHSHTRRNELETAVEQLHRAGARILGGVLNSIPSSADIYYSRYSQYYQNEGVVEKKSENGSILQAENGKSGLMVNIKRAQVFDRKPIFDAHTGKPKIFKGEG